MSHEPTALLAGDADRLALRRGLKDQVVEALGSDIVAGRLSPGTLLPLEALLLARFNVSRTVLREALTVLADKGLIETRQKRGTMIRPRLEWNQLDPSVIGWSGAPDDDRLPVDVGRRLDQLIEVRHIIEPAAAALAARRGTAEDLARIGEAYAAMEAAHSDLQAFRQADLAFHVACLRASGNDFLLPIAHAIRTAMTTSLRVTNTDARANIAVSLPLHKAILDAVLARDPDAASAAMTRHLADTQRRRDRLGRRPADTRARKAGQPRIARARSTRS
ncbi:FadR/GntR family transcriptional regulator [Comamonadaceae bacterium G21597-S1]|nr:FadR/GntR family transcriptional regulator [Comamonadaceae bacterium G21597-S1]